MSTPQRGAQYEAPQSLAAGLLRDATARLAADLLNESPSAQPRAKRYRTIWLSDIHLGTRGCKADFLLDFLAHHDSEYLYLVGDIIDGWQLGKSGYWTQAHNEIIRKFLKAARNGTQVVYVPGNHDEMFRDYVDMRFGGVLVAHEVVHETADGRTLLVIHGDEFDGVVRNARWLALLGDRAYTAALRFNHIFNWCRRKLGYPYWSLSAYLKHKVKNAVSFMTHFEHAVAQAAKERGVDGVVCGHIHKAEMRQIEGVLYCNDGDWVESCTALVEHESGELEILEWARVTEQSPEAAARQAPPRTVRREEHRAA